MFCTECGANNREGASFCRSCGQALAASDAQAQQSKAPRATLVVAAVAVAVVGSVAVLLLTGGDNDNPGPPALASPNPTSEQADPTAAESGSATTSTPLADESPDDGEGDTEEESFFDEVLAAFSEPSEGSGPANGGLARFGAMAVLTEIFAESGLDLAGVEIWVLPIGTGEEALLVLEIDEAKVGTLLTDEEAFQVAFANLLAAPAIDDARASRRSRSTITGPTQRAPMWRRSRCLWPSRARPPLGRNRARKTPPAGSSGSF